LSRKRVGCFRGYHVLSDRNAIYFEQAITEVVGEGLQIKEIKNGIEGSASVPKELILMLEKIIRRKGKTICGSGIDGHMKIEYLFSLMNLENRFVQKALANGGDVLSD
jgi:hypothetical protein